MTLEEKIEHEIKENEIRWNRQLTEAERNILEIAVRE